MNWRDEDGLWDVEPVTVLADELTDDVAVTIQVVDDDCIHITQGPDLVVIPIELWERLATEVMGAVMAAREDGS